MTQDDFLSIEEASEILNISRQKIEACVRDGILKPAMVGQETRFFRQDIQSLFESNQGSTSDQKARVLIIEDDLLVGQSLKNLLERFGYETAIASIGLAALDLI